MTVDKAGRIADRGGLGIDDRAQPFGKHARARVVGRDIGHGSRPAEHVIGIAARGLRGTGARLRFPRPEITRPLIEARVGVEVMDVQAACRTYNILVAEGRKVAAALLLEPGFGA